MTDASVEFFDAETSYYQFMRRAGEESEQSASG